MAELCLVPGAWRLAQPPPDHFPHLCVGELVRHLEVEGSVNSNDARWRWQLPVFLTSESVASRLLSVNGAHRGGCGDPLRRRRRRRRHPSLRERNEGGKRRPLFVAGFCGATSLCSSPGSVGRPRSPSPPLVRRRALWGDLARHRRPADVFCFLVLLPLGRRTRLRRSRGRRVFTLGASTESLVKPGAWTPSSGRREISSHR